MSSLSKRKEPPTPAAQSRKKQWRTPKKNQSTSQTPTIESGDAGIWATCDMHKEGKATAELRDLFEDHAVKMFGEDCLRIQPDGDSKTDTSITTDNNDNGDVEKDDDMSAGAAHPANSLDIEAEIANELNDMKKTRIAKPGSKHQPLFQAVRLDVQCVLFFKTRPPVEPVSFVESICRDANEGRGVRRSRWVKRLTPMSMMGKASWEGLEGVARDVLKDVFHTEGVKAKKFAIRPTIRNHSTMKRDDVIKQIAQIVGPSHSVDLKHYDCLILVDIYRNILGMSIVGSDYEQLKRFNLAEIYDPTPRPTKETVEAATTGDVGASDVLENTNTNSFTVPDDRVTTNDEEKPQMITNQDQRLGEAQS